MYVRTCTFLHYIVGVLLRGGAGDAKELEDKTKAATMGIDGAVDTVSNGVTLGRILQCTNKVRQATFCC